MIEHNPAQIQAKSLKDSGWILAKYCLYLTRTPPLDSALCLADGREPIHKVQLWYCQLTNAHLAAQDLSLTYNFRCNSEKVHEYSQDYTADLQEKL